MRAAVVGGGVFGCVIAVDLARAGFRVEVFEARPDILEGATARNQARLHRGYHYPRSDATAAAARGAAELFARRFTEAVNDQGRHWYALAPDSKTSPADYLAFLDRLGLPYQIADGSTGSPVPPPQIHTAELVVRVDEAFVDVPVLRRLLRRELAAAGVRVHTSAMVTAAHVAGFDLTVWATYGEGWPTPLRTEVCEVALYELGRYGGDSIVVLDGEFTSLDPRGPLHALYDVRHSVHWASEDPDEPIPAGYADVLARGIIRPGTAGSPLSHGPDMLEAASRFLWGLDPWGLHNVVYHGSLWSVRRVLPAVDGTDERPTLVQRDGQVIRVLAGKICTAATVGRQVIMAALS